MTGFSSAFGRAAYSGCPGHEQGGRPARSGCGETAGAGGDWSGPV